MASYTIRSSLLDLLVSSWFPAIVENAQRQQNQLFESMRYVYGKSWGVLCTYISNFSHALKQPPNRRNASLKATVFRYSRYVQNCLMWDSWLVATLCRFHHFQMILHSHRSKKEIFEKKNAKNFLCYQIVLEISPPLRHHCTNLNVQLL